MVILMIVVLVEEVKLFGGFINSILIIVKLRLYFLRMGLVDFLDLNYGI